MYSVLHLDLYFPAQCGPYADLKELRVLAPSTR